MQRNVIPVLLVLLLLATGAQAQSKIAPVIQPAIDGIFAAFKTHPLVGIGDEHGLAQEEDFWAALVRDPRFAQDVGNVVVEFGDASEQPIIDRYLAGENVSYSDLRKVWTNTVGWVPPPFKLGYANFFAQVRAANLAAPTNQRIHVWLGDPPLALLADGKDWASVRDRAEFKAVPGLRDKYPADLIETQILNRNKKALVIYGTWHFNNDSSLAPLAGPALSLRMLIDAKHPGALFVVTPYTGFLDKKCDEAFESAAKAWPIPAIVTSVRGTNLDDGTRRASCPILQHDPMPPGLSDQQKAQLAENAERMAAGVDGDALIYLGPAGGLAISANLPDIYLDDSYRQEVARHLAIIGPPNIDLSKLGLNAQANQAAPKYRKP